MSEGIRLHLGCGAVTPEGWVHIDGSWARRWKTKARILVRDVRKPLPFPDRSVRAVYTSHMLDFLYLSEAKGLLSECRRVLQPGGVIRVTVADMRSALQEYTGEAVREDVPPEFKGLPPMDRLMMRILLRPEPVRGNFFYRVYQQLADLHRRKWGYDAQSLAHHMAQAGFTDVSARAFRDSRIERIEEVERNRGVHVEGVRPG